MMEVNKKSRDFFMKHGASNFEVFSLENKEHDGICTSVKYFCFWGGRGMAWDPSYRDVEHVKEFSKSRKATQVGPLIKN